MVPQKNMGISGIPQKFYIISPKNILYVYIHFSLIDRLYRR